MTESDFQTEEHAGTTQSDAPQEQERETSFTSEFEALKRDLAHVRRDLKNLADAGMGNASGTAGATRARVGSEVRHAVDRLRSASGSAMDTEREMMDDMRRRVGDKPMTSVLAALGIGFAVGWLASRK